ncbi:MAG TPA: MoaD/ThiS family protein [Gammaproteobacteria bacterium]|nr:MoaD/ThiS family protein [Gammaproteobacteria bacterium]
MHITFKLYATLSDYLPADAEKHAIKIDVPEETTAHTLIDQYKVPREMAHLVLLNGVYMQPEERDQPKFKEGDTLAIWPPVAGG